MNVIEKRLHEHFANLTDEDNEPLATRTDGLSLPRDSLPEELDQPFAKVNSIVDNSPAATAGLKQGDLIRNFGYVNHGNHDSLRKVAECVQNNEGVRLPALNLSRKVKVGLIWLQSNILVKVSRSIGIAQTQELRLTLVPRRDWGGRGLLGCHILPL